MSTLSANPKATSGSDIGSIFRPVTLVERKKSRSEAISTPEIDMRATARARSARTERVVCKRAIDSLLLEPLVLFPQYLECFGNPSEGFQYIEAGCQLFNMTTEGVEFADVHPVH